MTKLKLILSALGSGLIAILFALLHIKNNKIKSLESENKAKDVELKGKDIATKWEREARKSQDSLKSASADEINKRYEDLWKK